MAGDLKQRVTLTPTGETVVVDTKAGTVTWQDHAKNYYKFAIATVGALVVILTQITPVAGFLGDNAKTVVAVATAVLTSIGVFLKANEQWVDKL
jgi:low affinity Fe/Cu permease